MAGNSFLPEMKNVTPEADSFRKRSLVFGVALFVLLLSGIITCVVMQQYLLIAAVVGTVVLAEIIWIVIMRLYMNKVRSLELKKNYIATQLVVGRRENIKKAEITSVQKNRKAYTLFLKDGRKLKTISGVKLTPDSAEKFFTKENLPGSELKF